MFRKIQHALNPMAHLGENNYSFSIPVITTIFLYICSELFGYFVIKQPNNMGTPDIILTFLLVIYFPFRFGIKGGMGVVLSSIVFFTYFIISHQAPITTKEGATATAATLTIIYALMATILGGLKQTINRLFNKEQQARIQAQQAEEKFHALADNIPHLCWMAKPNGSTYWYNKRWYEYTGTTLNQMKGRGWQSVHDPKKLPQILKLWQTSIKTGQPFEMVFPLKGANGKYRPFLTRILPIKNSSGKVAHWFGTSTDISEQVEIQKRKDDFLGMASHELKTPLTSMKVYTQLLLKELQDNPKANLLKKIHAQVD